MKLILTTTAAIFLMLGMAHAEGPSKETREKMAKNHEKMAQCLRSDKSMKDCHEDMKKSCMENHDECPMMGGKGMMMMKHHKMEDKKEQK